MAASAAVIPALPPGFQLEGEPGIAQEPSAAFNANVPPPPPGFQLENREPLVGAEGATDANAGFGTRINNGINAFVTGVGNAIAVPGRPDLNVNALATKIDSELPSWLGGESEPELQAQDELNARSHPLAKTLGGLTGAGIAGYAGGEIASPIADAIPGTGTLSKALKAAITGSAGGAAATPSNSGLGAVAGGTLSGLGSIIGSAISSSPLKAALLAKVGMSPTLATTNRLISGLGNALSQSRTKIMEFGKSDLLNAALKPFSDAGFDVTNAGSKEGIQDLQRQLYDPAMRTLNGTTIQPSGNLANELATTVRTYTTNTARTSQSPQVASYANDIIEMGNSGTLTGDNALNLYREIRNAGYSADNRNTQQALLDIAGTLRQELTNIASDGGQALDLADSLYGRTKVLQSAFSKSDDAIPTIQDFSTANRTQGRQFGSGGIGPYDALVKTAQDAYLGPKGTPSRWGNLAATGLRLAIPTVTTGIGEHVGGIPGALIGAGLGEAGEQGLAATLGAVGNKTVNNQATRSKLVEVLKKAGIGTVAAGANAMSQPNN